MAPGKSRPENKDAEAVTLSIHIQPRASKNEIVAMDGGGLKIRLTAPPVDGAANEALVKFLSDILSVPKPHIEIISGRTFRQKVVRISGKSGSEVRRLLNRGRE